jgi:hypothetical protein
MGLRDYVSAPILFYLHDCGVYPVRDVRFDIPYQLIQLHDNYFQRPAMHNLHRLLLIEFKLVFVQQRQQQQFGIYLFFFDNKLR